MIRRLGCLSALLSLLFFVVVVGSIGWFGYQAYLHATDAQAVASRTNEVGQAWTDDPAAVAKALGGKGGVRPRNLSSQPFQQMGARATTAYRSAGTTLTLTSSQLTCHERPLTSELVETPVSVLVLVHPENSWLPDVSGMWAQLRGGNSCTAASGPLTVKVTLATPVGRRIVVDAVTGESVAGR